MSSGGTTQTVQKQDPWKPIQPYLSGAANTAQTMFNSGVGSEYYPFSTYVPPSNQTQASWNMAENLAGQTPAYMGAAGNALTSTLNGDMLNNNPYLDQIYNRGADAITDRVNATFGSSGRTGSGAHQGVLADSLGDYRAQLYGGQYAQERDNQMRGMMMAPQLDQARYLPSTMLNQIGQGREGYAQNQLSSLMAQHDFMQQNPYDRYNQYLNSITSLGGMGGTAVQVNPKEGGGLGGAIGGGISGASAGSFFGPPGAAIGGILGALGGAFG